MTTVALFPSVLGVRQGMRDAAERLRADGHEVLLVDLYDGRVFDAYPPAMSFAWEETGLAALTERSLAAVAGLPDGFVCMGFSLGCVMAAHVATRREVTGVVMIAGVVPVSGFDDGRVWPSGVPAQTHSTVGDPWRDPAENDIATRDVESGGGSLEVFDYPGSGHLFTDPTLPDEFDAGTTELMWSRVLPFVRAHRC